MRDWSRIVAEVRPIAILTLSRGFDGFTWELEMNQFNRTQWIGDCLPPTVPTPSPPDPTVPPGHLRNSSLPVQEIRDAVQAAGLGLVPIICFSQDGGGFLSEFIAYLGVWHKETHDDPGDPDWCVAAGHIHIGANVSWPVTEEAVKVSLRALIAHVDCAVAVATCRKVLAYCDATPNSTGAGAVLDWTGSTSLLGNDLTLSASHLPPGQVGFLYYGAGRRFAVFGNGIRCVATPIHRILTPVSIDAAGTAALAIDLTEPPISSGPGQIHPGDTLGFQLWFTDPAAGGAGFSTSSALEVLFCP